MWQRHFLLCILYLSATSAYRTYECEDKKCTKGTTDSLDSAISILECKLTCLPYSGLWPAPSGQIQISSQLITVSPQDVSFNILSSVSDEVKNVVSGAQNVFISRLKGSTTPTDDTYNLKVNLNIADPDTTYFTSDVDESYQLKVTSSESGDSKIVSADISAPTFLGARHGLETLAQLVVHDDIHNKLRMPSSVDISDKPTFKHRGIAIDTARAFYSKASILDIIDGMSQNKLNSLKWHITDTQSFPYVSDAYPALSGEGAFSNDKVYTPADIKEIVEFARIRGVRVTPELDAPAHVGEGWAQVAPEVITCFKWEPWRSYCSEPPCGQLDPTKDRLYDMLHTIYLEWEQLFKSDLFHMGGDEVNLNCWKSTKGITDWMTANNLELDEEGFISLWDHYQTRSLEQLRAANNKVTPVLWTSSLTERDTVDEVLKPSDYIIQIWTGRTDKSITRLINKKYRVIFSNYDELYFDCGGASWVGEPGQNWCSPYIGWQNVYGHDPLKMIQHLGITITEEVRSLVLGSEAALWSEQIDDQNANGRLFPRGAALAERLWTNPTTTWKDAQYRMNNHRERLVRNGVRAELLQPIWCYQNDGLCP